jgi:hypothetical protein
MHDHATGWQSVRRILAAGAGQDADRRAQFADMARAELGRLAWQGPD